MNSSKSEILKSVVAKPTQFHLLNKEEALKKKGVVFKCKVYFVKQLPYVFRIFC